ncbi:hypothetical protein GRI58_12365 [Porphyrobacter algicida]|uniref:Insulinase family protein n=1 Tax=Qipengyuania algicida TaxID=1836209 RepID=A0A845AH87_9SPHN|nr:insulinase family protein [Qipengyuania algicida]MXP29610.1 hypothetical protein [Qipengyuania algicida]
MGVPSHAGDFTKTSDLAENEVRDVNSADGGWRPVVSGHLKNGVRFAILPRRDAEPGLGVLMRNEGGFIEERRPGERGLAHLIEHIAFLSPTINAPDDLHHLIKIGSHLTLPAPSAGTTSWRETNYFFSTTTNSLENLDKMLGLLREVATDLTFRRDAVDEGRAQVVQEMAGRKSGNDIYADYIAAVAPGSPTDVIDAQNSDDVPNANINTIRMLYHRLYQPANMMIVIVGNVDPAKARRLIQKRFGDWKGTRFVHTRVSQFQSDKIRPISFSARQQGRRIAMVTVVAPTPLREKSSRLQAESMLMDMLAIRVVNNRLGRTRPHSTPGNVGMFIDDGSQGQRMIMLWNNFGQGQWQSAVSALWRATCDIRTKGFSDSEWETARLDVLQDLQQRANTMGETPNVELAKDLSHALAMHRELIPPDQLLRYARSYLPTIRSAQGNQWFKKQWRRGKEHLRVEAPELAQTTKPIAAIRATASRATNPAICKVRQ